MARSPSKGDEPAGLRRASLHEGELLVAARLRLMGAAGEPLVACPREVPVPAKAGAPGGLEESSPGLHVSLPERLDPHGAAAVGAGALSRTGDRASQAAATRSIAPSSSGGAMTWRPTGRPAFVRAQGTLMAGTPARLAGSV